MMHLKPKQILHRPHLSPSSHPNSKQLFFFLFLPSKALCNIINKSAEQIKFIIILYSQSGVAYTGHGDVKSRESGL